MNYFSSRRFLDTLSSTFVILAFIGIMIFCYNFVDQYLVALLSDLNCLEMFSVFRWITYLGREFAYLGILFILALIFRYVWVTPCWEARAWFLWLCVAFSDAICLVLKITFGRARPQLLMQTHEYGFYWFKMTRDYWSFPSGHTSTVMSLAFGLGVLFPKYWIAFVSTAAVVALSRVLLIKHYISDVLLATYLALLEVTFLVYFLRQKKWLSQALFESKNR